jgi:hypothetical protein
MPWFSDRAGPGNGSRKRRPGIAFRLLDNVGTLVLDIAAQ